MAVLELDHINFSYGERDVLKDVSLSVTKGDYLGIIGPNGSAKTTLLKIMLGLEKPSQGHVKLFGTDLSRFKQWHRIGYVPQKVTAFNHSFPATVEEIVSASLAPGISLFTRRWKEKKQQVHSMLAYSGLEGFEKRMIGELSGGQQQRVFITRALMKKPEILILDEPTTGIDIASQQDFYTFLDRLNKEHNLTIIMVSHDIGIISNRVKSIACMGSGRLIMHDDASCEPVAEDLSSIYGRDMSIVHHNHQKEDL